MTRTLLAIVLLAACHPPAPAATPAPRCVLPPGRTVVATDGAARLERWDLADNGALFTPALPDDPVYRAFRDTVLTDGADLRRPIADRPPPADDAEREMWRREDHNAELVMSGQAGTLRPRTFRASKAASSPAATAEAIVQCE